MGSVTKVLIPHVPSTFGLSPGAERVVHACYVAYQKVGCIPQSVRGLEQAGNGFDLTEEALAEAIAKGALKRDAKGRVAFVVELPPDDSPNIIDVQGPTALSVFDEPEVQALPERSQNVLLRILMACDHYGRGPAGLAEMASHLKTKADIGDDISVLSDAGIIRLYNGPDGRSYYEVNGFESGEAPEDLPPSLYPEPQEDEDTQ